jgi:hypothetical protein
MADKQLREHLVQLLSGGQAHITFDNVMNGFPSDKAGIRPAGSPHSAWELLEHIRIAQDDIIRFSGVLDEPSSSTPKSYKALNWPDDYWPKSPSPRDEQEWKQSVRAVAEDLAAFVRFISEPKHDLFQPFPWGEGQTLLREALLIADHNAYHLGQLMLVRRMLEQSAASR